MPKHYRVGIIGVCHVHVHHVATLFQQHPRVELVACADTVPRVPELTQAPYTRAFNRQYLLERLGLERAYDDYRQMLDLEQLDLAICNSENSQHPAVVAACADHGVHVCVEKPMAASLADAQQMIRSATTAGIKVLIHWYMPFSPLMQRAKQCVDEGAIGAILELKMRAAHAGPLAPGVKHPGPNVATVQLSGPELASTWWYQAAAGGGALIDFCSYGAVLARWFLGHPPSSVQGWRANLNSPWGDADDTALIVARYAGALGVFEGSWTTYEPDLPGGPILYGTQGTLVVDEWGKQPAICLHHGPGAVTRHAGLPLPSGRRTIAEEFIHHLETGDPLPPTLEPQFNADATAVVDAAMRSAASGRVESIEEAASASACGNG
ncbi:MAG: Gfo/Idh/MocA family oxidoreductase [Verrucomicrobia bacterium]|nr:Gfo/Idh/MocA family oxidoreductase [Verrucomicrobiota bacterium]